MIPIAITVDTPRLTAELDRLARFSDAEFPAVTRVLFTRPDLEARAFLRDLLAEASLTIREDAAGNIFARWIGRDPNLAAIATGSHIDAIPHSGMYDGTVGVLGGLEAIRALRRTGFQPRRSIELVLFTSEEPTRFGIGCLGSRLMSGSITPAAAASLTGKDGVAFEEVRRQAGVVGDLADVRLAEGAYSGFVELHIEQGPLLEREGIAIGAVTAIAAPAALRVTIEGEGGHAGAVLMPTRKDALCAAAEIILAVETAGKESGRADTVATTGICQVHPGAINSIPSRVVLEIDIRDTDLASRDQAVNQVREAVDEVSRRRGVTFALDVINADPPATAGAKIVAAIQSACVDRTLSCKPMVSRAYHDSLFMARICPTSMIFIPCRDGVSHRPDEYSSPEAIADGVAVLALTLARLAGE